MQAACISSKYKQCRDREKRLLLHLTNLLELEDETERSLILIEATKSIKQLSKRIKHSQSTMMHGIAAALDSADQLQVAGVYQHAESGYCVHNACIMANNGLPTEATKSIERLAQLSQASPSTMKHGAH